MRKIQRITFTGYLPSERKPNENAAILRIRYSPAPLDWEEVELLMGEFIDLDVAPEEQRSGGWRLEE